MKQFLPFIFPLIALLIVLFLGFRWYTTNTSRPEGKISEFAEGIKIEDLSDTESQKLQTPTGVKDLNTVVLSGSGEAQGQVRYEVKDGKVAFSVSAELPELSSGHYQVWLKAVGGEARRRAFVLEMSKAGYTGSAAISTTTLPFEVVVSKEMKDDEELETTLFNGVVVQPKN